MSTLVSAGIYRAVDGISSSSSSSSDGSDGDVGGRTGESGSDSGVGSGGDSSSPLLNRGVPTPNAPSETLPGAGAAGEC